MSTDEIKALAQQAFVDGMSSHRAGLLDMEVRCKQYYAALLAYADMVERCEERIEELGKCCSYEKNNGVCPAARGEEVNLNNCLDESCPNGSIIEELIRLLKKGKTDERK